MIETFRADGVAAQGRGHIKNDIPCQDYVYAKCKNGVAAVVLCDGAGSAEFSHFGAEVVAKTATDFLINNFKSLYRLVNTQAVATKLINEVLSALTRFSSCNNIPLNKLACTLLFAALKKDECMYGQLGDGAICIVWNDAARILTIEQKTGAVNETYFVTSKDCDQHLRVFRGVCDENFASFMLMSDGSERSLIDARDPFDKKPAAAVSQISLWHQMVDSEDFCSNLKDALVESICPKTSDDCSVGVLSRINSIPRFNCLTKNTIRTIFSYYKDSKDGSGEDHGSLDSYSEDYELAKQIISLTARTPCTLKYIISETKATSKQCKALLNILIKEYFIEDKGELFSSLNIEER